MSDDPEHETGGLEPAPASPTTEESGTGGADKREGGVGEDQSGDESPGEEGGNVTG
jgi:hypothetical protein